MPRENTTLEYMANTAQGDTNYLVDGKCNGCIECCTVQLPLSNREFKKMRKLWKREYTERFYRDLENGKIYGVCPFASASEGCTIYEERPLVCRGYSCDGKGSIPADFFTKPKRQLFELYGEKARGVFQQLSEITKASR